MKKIRTIKINVRPDLPEFMVTLFQFDFPNMTRKHGNEIYESGTTESFSSRGDAPAGPVIQGQSSASIPDSPAGGLRTRAQGRRAARFAFPAAARGTGFSGYHGRPDREVRGRDLSDRSLEFERRGRAAPSPGGQRTDRRRSGPYSGIAHAGVSDPERRARTDADAYPSTGRILQAFRPACSSALRLRPAGRNNPPASGFILFLSPIASNK